MNRNKIWLNLGTEVRMGMSHWEQKRLKRVGFRRISTFSLSRIIIIIIIIIVGSRIIEGKSLQS